jgi:hypothetical protein
MPIEMGTDIDCASPARSASSLAGFECKYDCHGQYGSSAPEKLSRRPRGDEPWLADLAERSPYRGC